jgi:hypothetical protein
METVERLLTEMTESRDKLFQELFGKLDVQQTAILAAMTAMQKVCMAFSL